MLGRENDLRRPALRHRGAGQAQQQYKDKCAMSSEHQPVLPVTNGVTTITLVTRGGGLHKRIPTDDSCHRVSAEVLRHPGATPAFRRNLRVAGADADTLMRLKPSSRKHLCLWFA